MTEPDSTAPDDDRTPDADGAAGGGETVLAVRLLASVLPPEHRALATAVFEEVDEQGRWEDAADGLLKVAASMLVELSVRSNRTRSEVLRVVAERLAGPEGAAVVRPAPPDPDVAKHPGFDQIAEVVANMHARRPVEDSDADRDVLAMVSALMARTGDQDVQGDVLREYRDSEDGIEGLVAPLLMLGVTSMHLVRLFGGPEPEETVRAIGLGIAQGQSGLGPRGG